MSLHSDWLQVFIYWSVIGWLIILNSYWMDCPLQRYIYWQSFRKQRLQKLILYGVQYLTLHRLVVTFISATIFINWVYKCFLRTPWYLQLFPPGIFFLLLWILSFNLLIRTVKLKSEISIFSLTPEFAVVYINPLIWFLFACNLYFVQWVGTSLVYLDRGKHSALWQIAKY